MKFKVEIATDSVGFQPDFLEGKDDAVRGQLADVLRRLRTSVTKQACPYDRTKDDPILLRDDMGNPCGTAWFEEE